jgi:hypothetical protein
VKEGNEEAAAEGLTKKNTGLCLDKNNTQL